MNIIAGEWYAYINRDYEPCKCELINRVIYPNLCRLTLFSLKSEVGCKEKAGQFWLFADVFDEYQIVIKYAYATWINLQTTLSTTANISQSKKPKLTSLSVCLSVCS